MPQEIDFLRSKKETGAKQTRVLRLLKTGSLVLLIAYCLVAALVSSYWLYLRKESQTIKSKTLLARQEISEQKKTESLQILLKKGLSSLSQFFSHKTLDYSRCLAFLENISTAGVYLRGVELNQEGDVIFSGAASNAVILSNFLENLTSETGKSLFSNIVLSSASRGNDGDYNFSIQMEASEEPKS